MKKIIAITILTCFLSSISELHELFKFPNLVIHYFEHVKEDHDMSLSDYLHIHYSHHHDGSENDQQDNENLPFHDGYQTVNFLANVGDPTGLKLTIPVFTSPKTLNYSEFGNSCYFANIWQPPKIS